MKIDKHFTIICINEIWHHSVVRSRIPMINDCERKIKYGAICHALPHTIVSTLHGNLLEKYGSINIYYYLNSLYLKLPTKLDNQNHKLR